MGKGFTAFICGGYASMMHFMGSSYVETAMKGLIGGLTGYLGTVLMTLLIKKVKEFKNKKTKQ